MNYFENIHEFIADFRQRLILGKPEDGSKIRAVEQELSVCLPCWFKEYYESYGSIESATCQLLWSASQLLEQNRALRQDPDSQGFFPGHLGIVIGEVAGAGGPFLMAQPPNELKIWFASSGDGLGDIDKFASGLASAENRIYRQRYRSPLLDMWQGDVQVDL